MRVFTVGYQGLSIDEYVRALSHQGVGVVLDVRETPWSYKPGFSKTPLSEALSRSGIAYKHIKAAGNPSSNRKTAVDLQECLSRYRAYLAANSGCLEELFGFICAAHTKGITACLTCYERLPGDCHRSILLDALKDRHPEIGAVHIWEAQDSVLDLFAAEPVLI